MCCSNLRLVLSLVNDILATIDTCLFAFQDTAAMILFCSPAHLQFKTEQQVLLTGNKEPMIEYYQTEKNL